MLVSTGVTAVSSNATTGGFPVRRAAEPRLPVAAQGAVGVVACALRDHFLQGPKWTGERSRKAEPGRGLRVSVAAPATALRRARADALPLDWLPSGLQKSEKQPLAKTSAIRFALSGA